MATDDETGVPFIPFLEPTGDPRADREAWDAANAKWRLEQLTRSLNATADRRLAPPARPRTWRLVEPEEFVKHVVPRQDIVVHDVSEGCVCGPAGYVMSGHDECDHPDVWIHQHHALDGRRYPTLR